MRERDTSKLATASEIHAGFDAVFQQLEVQQRTGTLPPTAGRRFAFSAV